MKYLLSEGRIIALVEKSDVLGTDKPPPKHIDLLIVPRHYEDEIKNSHIWAVLLERVGNRTRKIIFF